MSLARKTAWITGAGGGIGEATAKELAAAGAAVALSGRRAQELERVAAEISAAGGRAHVAPLDVADADAVARAGEEIAAALGPVDILVANAGLNVSRRSFAEVSAADFAHVVDVDLNGVMNCTLAALPGMRARGGGLVVMVSSWAGRHAMALTGPAYNAAKHAVVALGQSLNMEEGRNGVRCTVLMPGEVSTPILDSRPLPPSAQDRERMLQAEDMGRTIRFLAEAPAHVCFNEILVSPTWNRIFIGMEEG